ncbi:hemagglutinin repeat-containing protein [Marinimicrobium locisalis]|uniref:hemagglutinin repeat-containing protein n=1 Tax=Marinimicrobium locisalis TaxID=546022 RepID=UPI0032220A61
MRKLNVTPNQLIAWAISLSLVGQPLAATAQIVIDGGADSQHQADLDKARNGVDIVNISAASEAGVSHNKFSEFNVDEKGLILNNSQESVATELGGYIAGNANLADGQASIILNEVTGNNRSTLNGFTEIAGKQAEYVLANQWGITCDGCGFINTPRVTLATGRPEMKNGALQSLAIRGGDVAIVGDGLNASNVDQVDILTRSMTVNAQIHADRLRLFTGANRYHYQDDTLTALAASEGKPAFALDSSALGGMYANAITLRGTERGVGVRLAADMATDAGHLIIDQAGRVEVNRLASGNRLRISTPDEVVVKGNLQAERIDIQTGSTLELRGDQVLGHSEVDLRAATLTNKSAIAAGYDEAGESNKDGLLLVSVTDALNNTSRLLSSDTVKLFGAQLNSEGEKALIQSEGALQVQGERLNNLNGATLLASNDLNLSLSQGVDNTGGVLASINAPLNLTTVNLNNTAGLIDSQADTQVTVTGRLNNTGGRIESDGDLTLNVEGSLSNSGGTIGGDGGQSLDVSGNLDNQGASTTFADHSLVLNLNELDNREGQILHSGEGLFELNIAERFLNQKGYLGSAGSIDLSAARIENESGYIGAANGLTLSANQLNNHHEGTLQSAADINLDVQGLLNNAGGGLIDAAGAATVKAGELNNHAGSLFSVGAGDASVTVDGQLDNTDGLLLSNGQQLSLALGNLVNARVDSEAGGVISHAGEQTFSLTASASINNQNGTLGSAGTLNLETPGTLNNQNGRLSGNTALVVSAGDIDNQRGAINNFGQGASDITARTSLNNTSGSLYFNGGANEVTLQVGTDLTNTDGEILHSGTGAFTLSAQRLDNQTNNGRVDGEGNRQGAQIASNGQLLISGFEQVTNQGAQLDEALRPSLITASHLTFAGADPTARVQNEHGQIVASGPDSLSMDNLRLLNDRGLVQSLGHATLNLAALENAEGTLHSLTDMTLSMDEFSFGDGELLADNRLTINTPGDIHVGAGRAISAPGSLYLNLGGNFSNRGSLSAKEVLSVRQEAGQKRFSNGPSAQMSGGQALVIHYGNVTNDGTLGSMGNVSLEGNAFLNRDKVIAGNALAGTFETIDNYNLLFSAGTLFLGGNRGDERFAATIDNHKEASIYALDDVDLRASGTRNLSARIDSRNGSIFISASQLINDQETINVVRGEEEKEFGIPSGTGSNQMITQQFWTPVESVEFSGEAEINAGENLNISAGYITNKVSTLTAGENIVMNGVNLSNVAFEVIEEGYQQTFPRGEGGNEEAITITPTTRLHSTYDSKILAGGLIQGDFTDRVNNTTVREGQHTPGDLKDHSVSVSADTVEGVTVSSVEEQQSEPLTAGNTGAGEQESGGPPKPPPAPVASENDVELADIYKPAENLTLPKDGGLFVVKPDPQANYLVETNPQLTGYLDFLSSDYLLERLNVDPSALAKRLGDGFYETELLRESIWNTRGRRYLTDTSGVALENDRDQFQYLMDNAVAASRDLNLSPGVALTAEQASRLTQDIVWLEEQVVNGETVLTPVYYATTANGIDFNPQGPVLAGGHVDLNADGGISNDGTLNADGYVNLRTAGGFNNAGRVSGGSDLVIDAGAITSEQVSDHREAILESRQGNMNLLARTGDISTLSGRVSAGDLSIQALQGRIENRADIEARGDLVATAKTHIVSVVQTDGEGGRIRAGNDLTLVAEEGDIVSQSTTRNVDYVAGDMTVLAGRSELSAGNDLTLNAGQDIQVTAGEVKAGDDASLKAGNDIKLEALETRHTHMEFNRDGYTLSAKDGHEVTEVSAGGDLSLVAGRDLTSHGARLSAEENVDLQAKRDTRLLSVTNTYTQESESFSKGSLGRRKSHSENITQTEVMGTQVQAGGNITVNSARDEEGNIALHKSRDVYIQGGQLVAGGELLVGARQDIRIEGETEVNRTATQTRKQDWSGLKSRRDWNVEENTRYAGSELTAANDAVIASGRDTDITGSQVTAGNNLNVQAGVLDEGGNLTLDEGLESQHRHQTTQKRSPTASLEADENSVNAFVGNQRERTSTGQTHTRGQGSTLAAGNNVVAHAANNLVVVGATVAAGNDASLTADNDVLISPGRTETTTEQNQRTTRDGLGLTLNHNVGQAKDALENLGQGDNTVSKASSVLRTADALNNVQPSASAHLGKTTTTSATEQQAQGARASHITAGGNITVDAGNRAQITGTEMDAGGDITVTGKDVFMLPADTDSRHQQSTDFKQTGTTLQASTTNASLTAGYAKADSQQVTQTTGQLRNQLNAGGSILVEADNNVRVRGSDFTAEENIDVNAGNDLDILAGTGTEHTQSHSDHESASAGVNFGQDGLGATARGAGGNSRLERDSLTHQNSQLTAGNTVSLTSGNDANLSGVNAKGRHLNVDVDGDLTVASVQDTGNVDGRREEYSGSVTVGAGVSGGASVGQGETDGSTAWVNNQTSLIGTESVTVHVEDHTQLDGALIANLQEDGTDGGNLTFSTGTLGYTHLEDHDKESGTFAQVGVSTGGSAGANANTGAPESAPGGSANVAYTDRDKDREQITRATLGDGAITVRDNPNQDLSDLNRDTDKAQEVLKDKDDTTDVYVSTNSVEAVKGLAEKGEDNTAYKWASNIGSVADPDSYKDIVNNGSEVIVRTQRVVDSLGHNLDQSLEGQLAQSGEQAINALMRAGLSEAQSNQFLKEHPETIAVITELQAVRGAMESGSVDSGAVAEKASDNAQFENGVWTATITEGRPQTQTEAAVQVLGSAQQYMDKLLLENPTAARFTEIAISGAMGGPVKAAVTIPINEALNQTVGEHIAQAMDAVTDVAGSHVTSDDETVDQFRDNVDYIGPEGREGKIKDGSRFVLTTVLGIGIPGKAAVSKNKGGNDKPNEASEKPEWDNAVSQADGDFGYLNQDPPNHTLSNVEARKWYLEQESRIPGRIDPNASLDKQARQAFDLRNQARTKARDLMGDREAAELITEKNPNLTWDQVIRETESKLIERGAKNISMDDIYAEIIESSQRSRKSVNKGLGL